MDRTSVARRIQLGAVRILQTKIAEASDGIMANLQYWSASGNRMVAIGSMGGLVLSNRGVTTRQQHENPTAAVQGGQG